MSPALFEKYLAAAQEIAAHAVLLPDGFRFSKASARRDQTDEVIDQILALYAEKTEVVELRMTGGNRDGRIRWGRLPLTPYIEVLIEHREKLAKQDQFEVIAKANGLNPVYLGHLSRLLSARQPSPLLAQLQRVLRQTSAVDAATVDRETAAIVDWITGWQNQLLALEDIGQLFTPGQQPLNPITTSQEFRLALRPSFTARRSELSLVAHDGDGNAAGRAVWKNARLEHADYGEIPLRDMLPWFSRVSEFRRKTLARTEEYLAAVAAAAAAKQRSTKTLAKEHKLDPDVLAAWADYLEIPLGSDGPTRVAGLIMDRKNDVAGLDWIKGWGANPPNLIANSSDTEAAKVPGDVPPRTVGVHPTPAQYVGVGWQSPITGAVNIEAQVIDRHAGGNGVEWWLIAQRGARQERLASGVAADGQAVRIPAVKAHGVRTGDVLSLRIGPRDANHACDQTQIDLVITEQDGKSRIWSLAKDVSADLHAGNPHADSLGNAQVWYFYTAKSAPTRRPRARCPRAPCSHAGALRSTPERPDEAARIAKETAVFLASDVLARSVRPIAGSTVRRAPSTRPSSSNSIARPLRSSARSRAETPLRCATLESTRRRLCITTWSQASPTRCPSRSPPSSRRVGHSPSRESSPGTRPDSCSSRQLVAVVPQGMGSKQACRSWSGRAILVVTNYKRHSMTSAPCFPRAMCCRTIVPIDKVITLVMYHREDEPFRRLLLTEPERERLDRLWRESAISARTL